MLWGSFSRKLIKYVIIWTGNSNFLKFQFIVSFKTLSILQAIAQWWEITFEQRYLGMLLVMPLVY